MEYQFVSDNITNPATLIPAILKAHKSVYEAKAFEQYEPENHEIVDTAKRPDKIISVPVGNDLTNDAGDPLTTTKIVKVNRISIPYQKTIVRRAVAFLNLKDVKLDANPKNNSEQAIYDDVVRTWRKNKLGSKTESVAFHMMSETECCEIWYSRINQDTKEVELRVRVFAPSDGNQLIPIFNRFGDLISFAIKYSTVDTQTGIKEEQHLDLYTKEFITRYVYENAGWVIAAPETDDAGTTIPNPLPNPFGKIPVVYYWQPRAEWADVQPAIDRMEYMVSNMADNNDYHASPTLVVKGDIKGFAEKGEQGKILEIEDDAEVRYETWDQAPEAVKLEYDTLKEIIYSQSQTPDLSTREMKELGDISGVAYDRILIEAHMKAMSRQNGDFGEMIQRRLNFLVAAISKIKNLSTGSNLEITPQFSLFRLNGDADRLEVALKANGGQKVMSQMESIVYFNVSKNPEQTLQEIQEENEAAIEQQALTTQNQDQQQ